MNSKLQNQSCGWKACLAAIGAYLIGIIAVLYWLQEPSQGRNVATVIILLTMALPLIIMNLRNRCSPAQLELELNNRLQEKINEQTTLEEELQEATKDLRRFVAATNSREDRILELKAEVNELLEQLNNPKRYHI